MRLFSTLIISTLVLLSIAYAQESGSSSGLSSSDRLKLLTEEKDRVGKFVNRTGKEGIVFLPTGTLLPETFSLQSIERMETRLTDEHRKGREAFEMARISGNNELYRQALTNFLSARNSIEKRTWLRIWITAEIVLCYTALEDRPNATREALVLCQADPYTPWLHVLPLKWASETTPFNDPTVLLLEQTVQPWLGTERPDSSVIANPSAALLAASILLEGSPKYRASAEEVLKKLVALNVSGSPAIQERITAISLMATAQIWRLKINRSITEKDRQDWIRIRNLMPDEIRLGPDFLIAVALAKSDDSMSALDSLLRIPLLWPEQKEMARNALLWAVRILKKNNRTLELNRLQNDLQRFEIRETEPL